MERKTPLRNFTAFQNSRNFGSKGRLRLKKLLHKPIAKPNCIATGLCNENRVMTPNGNLRMAELEFFNAGLYV